MKSMSRRVLRAACVSLLLVICSVVLSHATAQAGTFDPTFDVDGRVITHVGQSTQGSVPVRVFTLPDGKVLVAGENAFISFHAYVPAPLLVRYNSDGTPDTTFGTNGLVSTDIPVPGN